MRLDPAERERAEVTQWLNSCIETLNIQVQHQGLVHSKMYGKFYIIIFPEDLKFKYIMASLSKERKTKTKL